MFSVYTLQRMVVPFEIGHYFGMHNLYVEMNIENAFDNSPIHYNILQSNGFSLR